MTSGKMTSFLLYPKHAEIMQAAAETCCEGNFSRFAQEAVLRLAAGLGVTTGELHLGDVPPLSLMADVRYLDRYLL
ncbi:MAG: hypothetical protein ACO3JL_20115, partial [Myxococcota bacterium]